MWLGQVDRWTAKGRVTRIYASVSLARITIGFCETTSYDGRNSQQFFNSRIFPCCHVLQKRVMASWRSWENDRHRLESRRLLSIARVTNQLLTQLTIPTTPCQLSCPALGRVSSGSATLRVENPIPSTRETSCETAFHLRITKVKQAANCQASG